MRLFWGMLAGAVFSALLVTSLSDENRMEVWLGMAGPLASALVTWIAIRRRYARSPGSLTGFMIKSFAAKMVCFALYIAVVIKSGAVQPFPFVISFMCYYISLHLAEALGLHRLQSPGPASRVTFRNGSE